MSSATEEYEPLGQKINNWDPSGDDDPPSGTPEPIGSASDPEWQCQIPTYFYGGFSGMPWHCQWADIKRRAFEGEQLWKFESEEDPHKIGGAKKAEGGGSQAVNLTATDKPEMEAEGGSPVDPASMPSADGSNIDFEQQVDEKRNVSFDDSAGVGVTVNGMDDTVPGLVDASQAGQDVPASNCARGICFTETKKKAVVVGTRVVDCFERLLGVTPELRNEVVNDEQYTSATGILLTQNKDGKWEGNFRGKIMNGNKSFSVKLNTSFSPIRNNDGTLTIGQVPSVGYSGVADVAADHITKNYDSSYLLVVVIHEVANGAANANYNNLKNNFPIAQDPLLYAWDKDAGNAVEECVFGGKVSTRGYILKLTPQRQRRR